MARCMRPRARHVSSLSSTQSLAVALEDFLETPGEGGIADSERDLVVGLERAVVEVARADGAPDAVDRHHLLMQQARVVLEDAHAVRPAAPGSCGARRAARSACPTRRPTAPSRARRRRAATACTERIDRLAAPAGSTDSGCGCARARRTPPGDAGSSPPARSLRASGSPRARRRRPHVRARGKASSPTNSSPVSSTQFSLNAACTACTIGAAQPHAEIAHVLAVLGVAEPAVDDAVAADQGDPAVEHHELAMIAVVEHADVAQLPRVVQRELAAGLAQAALGVVAHLLAAAARRPARAPCTPARRRSTSASTRRRAEHALLPEKGLEVHGARGRRDLLEHGVEEGAVLEELDGVAQVDGALRQARQRRQQLATADRRNRSRATGSRWRRIDQITSTRTTTASTSPAARAAGTVTFEVRNSSMEPPGVCQKATHDGRPGSRLQPDRGRYEIC